MPVATKTPRSATLPSQVLIKGVYRFGPSALAPTQPINRAFLEKTDYSTRWGGACWKKVAEHPRQLHMGLNEYKIRASYRLNHNLSLDPARWGNIFTLEPI